MDAPPEKEPLAPFLEIHTRLKAAALHVPELFQVDEKQGFLCLEDFGHTDYLSALTSETVESLYESAFNALFQMQCQASTLGLAPYDAATLQREMALFPDWCLSRHCQRSLNEIERQSLDNAFQLLIDSALSQPQVFVHRDFHSRNLMVTLTHNPGILDFQDALHGPITYDLVSLLRDCYIEWPIDQVQRWVFGYYTRLQRHGFAVGSPTQFQKWFDFMGLQRHLKVLGIFCRLYHRDGKSRYLNDLPLTLKYARQIAGQYDELNALATLLESLRL